MQLDRETSTPSLPSEVLEAPKGALKDMERRCDVASFVDAFVAPRPAHTIEVRLYYRVSCSVMVPLLDWLLLI